MVEPSSYLCRILFVALSVAVLFMGTIQSSSAATMDSIPTSPVTVSISSASLSPSAEEQTINLEVRLDAEGSDAFCLAGFQFSLEIGGSDASLQFVSAAPPAGSDYPFLPGSAAPFFRVSGDGQQIELGDFLNSGFATINDDTLLATLQLSLAAGASASAQAYEITVDQQPTTSFLAFSLSEFVPYSAASGQVLVVVPEPTSLVLLSLAMIAVAACARQIACVLR